MTDKRMAVQLQVMNKNGQLLVDSRQVAEMIGKEHDQLMRSIRTYLEYLESAKMQSQDFFINSTYINTQNKELPCFLLTRKGCDLVANKMTGEKGVLFTAAYVTQFENMEKQVSKPQSQLEMLQVMVNQMVEKEKRDEERDSKILAIESSVETLSYGLTAVPDASKVVERVNEYARYTRMGHDEIYNSIYQILKAQHGIDVKARVENERRKINADYYARTGKLYAESTLKKKVNGVDVMVRMGALDKFNSILVGLLAKAKGIPTA
jgi:Rha family phage regulatory protein